MDTRVRVGPHKNVEGSSLAKRSGRSSNKSSKFTVHDSINKPKMLVKNSSPKVGRPCVPYYVEVHESIIVEMDEVITSKRR